MIHTLEGIASETIGSRTQALKDYNDTVKEAYRIPLKIDKDLYDNLGKYNLLKVSLSSDDHKELVAFQEIVKQNIKEVHAAFSAPTLLDINAPKASKGEAVLKLAAKYHIEPHEIIAIGDNENDIAMLKVCGLPLTLENARDTVKKIAKYVTKSNNANGVADAIERYVL